MVLLGFVGDEIAVEGELTDDGIDLPDCERHRWLALEIAADEAILAGFDFQRGGAGSIDRRVDSFSC